MNDYMGYRIWTKEEEQYIKDNFIKGMNTNAFARANMKRLNKTLEQITNKIGEMGLNRSYSTSDFNKLYDADEYKARIKHLKSNLKIGDKVKVREYIDCSWVIDRIRTPKVAEIYKHHVLVDFGKYKSSYRWDELEAIL
ncbi:MAG: hypothetical protein GX915_06110 [Clostridiales bacterium]|nr:hypothetical protein [Clostridiales bacterium]